MAKTTTETKEFKTHPRLLWDVIQRQAGSLSKAILEAVMNGADAQANSVQIIMGEEELTVRDDGTGFKSKEAVEKNFGVFGMPQDEIEQLEKTYGHFRMGRGQMFNFGANEWRTGEFRMTVDLKTAANSKDYKIPYELTDGLTKFKGCEIKIRLYEPQGLVGVEETRRDLEKWCKWALKKDLRTGEMVPMKVYFNGNLISQDPNDSNKWDHETDEAWIKLTDGGSLSLYNLGIHVCEIPKYKFGSGGEVVSKQQVKVNFARNDIQSDCPVWKKIRPFVAEKATERATGRSSMDDAERKRMADQLRRGELSADKARSMKLITACTGRHYSIQDMMYLQGFQCYSVDRNGSRLGDNLMKSGMAFVFAQDTLDRFEMSDGPRFIKWLKQNVFDRPYEKDACKKPFKEINQLREEFDNRCKLIPAHEWTTDEKLWMSVIGSASHCLLIEGNSVYGYNARKLVMGDSDLSQGWTDGETYVAIQRKYLSELKLDVTGLTAVGLLLVHEACHGESDFGDHDHGQDFYEKFHDCATAHFSQFLAVALRSIATSAGRLNKQLTKKQMQSHDKIKNAERVAAELSERASVAARNVKSNEL